MKLLGASSDLLPKGETVSYRPTEKEIHQYVRIFVKTAKRELSKPWKEKEMSCKHTIGTAVDEDGCCVSCGADLNPIAMAETPSPIHKWLKEDAVRYDLTTEEIIQQLCEENEAYQAELADARKKPEPTVGTDRLREIAKETWVDSCAPQRHILTMADEFDNLTAENKLLKWLLGKRRKAEGHWCDVSRLNAELKAKDEENAKLTKRIIEAQKHLNCVSENLEEKLIRYCVTKAQQALKGETNGKETNEFYC